jgi:hypothetical protein
MLRWAEPRSRTSWCQSFRAKREIRSFRHIADQGVAHVLWRCAMRNPPLSTRRFCGSTHNNTARSEAGAVRRSGSTGGNGGQLCVRNERGKARAGAGFALGAGYELRRANTEESAVIKETTPKGSWHSQERCRGSCGYSPGGSVEPLEEAEWRYHVISFRGSNQGLLEIEEAFNLAQLDLEIGLTILNSPGHRGLILHPGRLFQLLESAMWNLTF